jgi:molecular chaperone HtpG
MEINPTHKLEKSIEAERDDDVFADLGKDQFDQALLAEGGMLEDPASFVKRMNSLIS